MSLGMVGEADIYGQASRRDCEETTRTSQMRLLQRDHSPCLNGPHQDMKFCGHWGRNSPQARSSTGCVVRDGTAEDPSQGMERITNESSNPKDLSQRSVPGVCHLTEVQYFSSGDFSLDELACSRLPHLQTSETLNLDSPYNSLVLRYLPNMFRRGVLVESKLPLAANNSNFSICQEDNRGPSSSQLDESRADITAAHVNRSVKLDLSFLCNLPADGESSELDQESNILNRTIKCDRVVVNSDVGDRNCLSGETRMQQRIECDQCRRSFGKSSDLSRHIQTIHLDQRKFSCGTCHRRFKQRAHCLAHYQSVHEGSRPFNCPTCQERFSRKATLKKHIVSVHERVRPHSCGICGRRFAQRADLARHNKNLHETTPVN